MCVAIVYAVSWGNKKFSLDVHYAGFSSLIYIVYVTVSAKTVLNGTCTITRKTDLKYSSCCGSVVLDFSHARFTV